jgi:UDP-N-acetylglucosamine 4-epimerase
MKKNKKNHLFKIVKDMQKKPKTWLITGVAGFIGSNLLERLLNLNQKVIGIDNFVTGYRSNLDNVRASISSTKWKNFKFIRGDICNFQDCIKCLIKVDYVLHQAALGSVPRSIKDPLKTHKHNVNGFLNILLAAKNSGVKNFVYASSSSVYGDHQILPKVEDKTGNLLSPYAATKSINEIYSSIFFKNYNFKSIGLRYFNVFGKRQDPNGSYAAVIPKWIVSMIQNKRIKIFGDGKTTRDFCYIENVIQANILAALTKKNINQVFNVALGNKISLNNLFISIKKNLAKNNIFYKKKPVYKNFRNGDIRHSLADISKIKKELKYLPTHSLSDGILALVPWYIKNRILIKVK